MPITDDGVYRSRVLGEVIQDLQDAVETQLGEDHALSEADPAQAIIEAVALTLAEAENEHEDIFRQMLPPDATQNALDKHLDLIGEQREQATKASGKVNLTLTNSLNKNDYDPFFPDGSLTFIDANDRRYDQDGSVTLPDAPSTTNTSVVDVEATFLGTDGNITNGQIVDVDIDSSVRQRFAQEIDSFNNDEGFTGGQARETDPEVKRRVRRQRAAQPGASLSGLIRAADEVNGVESTDGIENNDPYDAQTENTLLDGEEDGSQTVEVSSGGNVTKVAHKFTPDNRRFHQDFTYQLAVDSDLVGTVSIQTHDSANDEPSGALVHDRLESTGFDLDGTKDTSSKHDKGKYLSADTTYWSVFEATGGSGKFEASSSTTKFSVGSVKFEDSGSWVTKTTDNSGDTVTSINNRVLAGVPPGAVRIFASGEFDGEELAQQLLDTSAGGIALDGRNKETAEDREGEKTIYWEEPVDVFVTVSVTLETLEQFSGDEDQVKDVIVDYIGGTDTNGVNRTGLEFDDELILNRIESLIMDPDNFAGVKDITTMRADRKSNTSDPANLDSGNTVNLEPAPGERFQVEDVNTDVSVTINEV
jgi:hypothetical protein